MLCDVGSGRINIMIDLYSFFPLLGGLWGGGEGGKGGVNGGGGRNSLSRLVRV